MKNLVGAQNQRDLHRAEADLSNARTIQLLDHQLIDATRDGVEIRGLHRHLFQDIYPWAGAYRRIDMRRGAGEFFAPFVMVPNLVDTMCATLFAVDNLRGLDRRDFLRGLADFYDQLNYAHPFRDGNRRAQRLFWSRIAFDAGWILDWRPVKGVELNESSRLARENADFQPLLATLDRCLSVRG